MRTRVNNNQITNEKKDNNPKFDIVVPVGPNDRNIVCKQIEYTKRNVIGYRNIYLICYDPSIVVDGCITIDENIFPFTIDTVRKFHGDYPEMVGIYNSYLNYTLVK